MMIILKKNLIITFIFLSLFKLSIADVSQIAKDSVTKVLIVNSLESIVKADTNVIYDYIDIYELDSIINGLESVKKLHFKKLFYEGHIRESFPYFNNKVVELKKISISGKKLKNIPSFVIVDSLEELTLEANNYNIDFDLSRCQKLQCLKIYTKNSYEKLDKICRLVNLKKLVIQEKSGKKLNDLGCLKNLDSLTSLYLSIKLENLGDLSQLPKLRELYIGNKISYQIIMRNLQFFKSLDKVSFLNFSRSKVEEETLKRELKDIWQ